MYPTCAIDWYSRCIIGWRLASDMGAAGVCECVSRAFGEHGGPTVVNSDQGSVFSSAEYEALLGGRHVLQGVDGKARRVDDVTVERWFCNLRSECPRANEYETPAELRRLVAGYAEQYNDARKRQSLGYETPASGTIRA